MEAQITDSIADSADLFGMFDEIDQPAKTLPVRVSAKMANLRFHGCDPDYIRNTCRASCCQSSTSPNGTLITIHPTEEAAITALGGVIRDGLLQPRDGEKRCPFKTDEHLCGIHFTGEKPFGCIASPFTLNGSGTLIVRNRYIHLKCYRDGEVPAYVAFRASLDLIFGADESARICDHLAAGGGDILAQMPLEAHAMLMKNDAIKRQDDEAPALVDPPAVPDPAPTPPAPAPEPTEIAPETAESAAAAPPAPESDSAATKPAVNGFSLYGHDLFGDAVAPTNKGPIATRFTMPPFTILDARGGDWQDRKRAWISMGIKSELGRGGDLISYGQLCANEAYGGFAELTGTSIFDPVLCEMMYRWFSPERGLVIDPFAGGSCRGIVAGCLGRDYWGVELRKEQVEANRVQAVDLKPEREPTWICGDSAEMMQHSPPADFLIGCPPYGDLEVYSDQPEDLSNMKPEAFDVAYREIIRGSVARLKEDSFAAFVVGDYRDGKGHMRNFVSNTIEAFESAGARLYNEAILVTAVGTAAVRVTKQFTSGRKMAKTHQNVLIFCKGSWKRAAEKCNAK